VAGVRFPVGSQRMKWYIPAGRKQWKCIVLVGEEQCYNIHVGEEQLYICAGERRWYNIPVVEEQWYNFSPGEHSWYNIPVVEEQWYNIFVGE
jgi:hypothetical protein